MIEHARRAGWAMLIVSALAMLAARTGPATWHFAASAVAIGAGVLGLLAIVNVALVRGLYKQLGAATAGQAEDDRHD